MSRDNLAVSSASWVIPRRISGVFFLLLASPGAAIYTGSVWALVNPIALMLAYLNVVVFRMESSVLFNREGVHTDTHSIEWSRVRQLTFYGAMICLVEYDGGWFYVGYNEERDISTVLTLWQGSEGRRSVRRRDQVIFPKSIFWGLYRSVLYLNK